MNSLRQFADNFLFCGLMLLLGLSFHLSAAATNIFYYLLVLCSLIVFLLSFREMKELWWDILRSPLWRIVTLWAVLLYLSAAYSDADELLWKYAKKYFKYLFIFFPAYLVLFKKKDKLNLPIYFSRGFLYGGVLSFSLAILNKSTGLLSLAGQKGWFPMKYVLNDYWISIDAFAHSTFMVVLFVYGAVVWLRTKRLWGLAICAMALFEVFVISRQRTGYVAIAAVFIWLLWLRLPSLKQKLLAIACVIGLGVVGLSIDTPAASRIKIAVKEWQKCHIENVDLVQSKHLQEVGKDCHSSIGLRKMFYHDSWNKITQSWLYGHGLGNLNIDTIAYDWEQKKYQLRKLDNPHNEYLLQGIQLGLFGVVLLISLFIMAYYQAMRLDSFKGHVFASIVLIYSISCLFNSYLLDMFQGMFFTLFLAFLISESINKKLAI